MEAEEKKAKKKRWGKEKIFDFYAENEGIFKTILFLICFTIAIPIILHYIMPTGVLDVLKTKEIKDTVLVVPPPAPTISKQTQRANAIKADWQAFLQARSQKCKNTYKFNSQIIIGNNKRKIVIQSTSDPILKQGTLIKHNEYSATIQCPINTKNLQYRTDALTIDGMPMIAKQIGQWVNSSAQKATATITLNKQNNWQVQKIEIDYFGIVDMNSINNCDYSYTTQKLTNQQITRINNCNNKFEKYIGRCNDDSALILQASLKPNSFSEENIARLKCEATTVFLLQQGKEYVGALGTASKTKNPFFSEWICTAYHCTFKKKKPLEVLKIKTSYIRASKQKWYLKEYDGRSC